MTAQRNSSQLYTLIMEAVPNCPSPVITYTEENGEKEIVYTWERLEGPITVFISKDKYVFDCGDAGGCVMPHELHNWLKEDLQKLADQQGVSK